MREKKLTLRNLALEIDNAVSGNPELIIQLLDLYEITHRYPKTGKPYLLSRCGKCGGNAALFYDGNKSPFFWLCYESMDMQLEPYHHHIYYNNFVGFIRSHVDKPPMDLALEILEAIEVDMVFH